MVGDDEQGSLGPGSTQVTTEWRAEMDRKRRRYEAQRKQWIATWESGGRAEPATDEADGKGRRGRIIHDRRQFRFDL